MSNRQGMSESDAGYLGYLASRETHKNKYKLRKELYYKNPKLCKECGKIIEYEHRRNTFCSKSCSISYSNRHKNRESNIKGINKYYNDIIRFKNEDNKYTVIYKKDINENNINEINNILSSLSHPRFYDINTKKIYKYKKTESKNESEKIENKRIKSKKTKSKKQICKICGCEKGFCVDSFVCKHYRIFKSLERFGFDKNTIGTKLIVDEFYKIRDLLEYEYKVNRISENELLTKYNYSSGLANFHKLIKSLGIESLSMSESIKNAIKLNSGEIYNSRLYKSEYHISWDGCIYFLRSSYEIDFANQLDSQKIYYKVENLRISYLYSIDNKYHIAIPDFYIPDEKVIYEIKSVWTLKGKIQQMKDKFKEYINQGYTPKLILEHKEVDINILTEENIHLFR